MILCSSSCNRGTGYLKFNHSRFNIDTTKKISAIQRTGQPSRRGMNVSAHWEIYAILGWCFVYPATRSCNHKKSYLGAAEQAKFLSIIKRRFGTCRSPILASGLFSCTQFLIGTKPNAATGTNTSRAQTCRMADLLTTNWIIIVVREPRLSPLEGPLLYERRCVSRRVLPSPR